MAFHCTEYAGPVSRIEREGRWKLRNLVEIREERIDL